MSIRRPHIYLVVKATAWPIVEPTTFLSGGILHAVAFRDATAAAVDRRKTRDSVCGRRIQPTPITVPGNSKARAALPWPPPARNGFGTRCPDCFATASPKRPDWTWTDWSVQLDESRQAAENHRQPSDLGEQTNGL